MAEKVKFSISPAVAAYVRPGSPPEVRMAGCSAADSMSTHDRIMLLFCLSKDAEPIIRSLAISLLKSLPEEIIREYQSSANANVIIQSALSRLLQNSVEPASEVTDSDLPPSDAEAVPEVENSEDAASEEAEAVNVEDEEYQNKYKMAQTLGIAEKIKMALTGDKEWRSILVKDANKLVSGSVIKNPRITESEILTLVKSGSPSDEIMRLICSNKEWVKEYKIRKALIENNRTPVPNAMRYLGTMGEKDLASFAKSKNISTVIATMAKRLLLNKKK